MANTKITQHVIADDAITTAMITDANITPAKLHGTLDLSSKTLTLPAVAIPSASTATTQSASDNSTKVATTAYVETAISNLVDSSPSSLNTLNELAAALNDDASFSTTVTNSLATKAPLASPTFTSNINGGDNVSLRLGASQDLQIYHDGTNSAIQNTTGDLFLYGGTNEIRIRAKNDEESIVANPNGPVYLYHDGTVKFETIAYGVNVSGTGALRIPQGTTAQRPSAATGQLRWNTTDGALEVYNGSAWTAVGTGSSNKILDTFTGDNSTTDFTLSVTPANEDALIVFIDGVYQEKGDYTLTNAVLALDTAPASGEKIAVHITTASVHDGTSAVNQQFTATAGQTAFTLSADPKSENNTQVYINGVYQQKTDYTVSGTTLTFDTGLTVGDVVEVNSFTVATLGNTDTVSEGTTNLYHTTARARSAISVSGNALSYNSSTGVITSAYEESPTFTGTVTSAGLAVDTDTLVVDASNNRVGIGTTSPQAGLDLASGSKGTWSSGNTYHIPSGNAYIKVQGTAAQDNWIGITGGYDQSSGSANLLLQANLRLVNEQAGNYISSEAQSSTSADMTFGKMVGGSTTSGNSAKDEFMRISSAGNIGLGTTSPKELSGQKSLTINASVPRIDFKVGNVFKHHILAEAEYMSIGADSDNNQSNSRVIIEADNAVVARFDSDGIKFGADTAAANALDDYEEGTWTPALYTYGGVSTTSSSNYGIYTKIGNICHIHCKISATLSSLPGQNWVITGLPFAGLNTTDTQQRAIFAIGGDCLNTGGNTPKAHFRIASNELHGIYFNASNNTAYWSYAHMDSSTFELNVHGFYTTT